MLFFYTQMSALAYIGWAHSNLSSQCVFTSLTGVLYSTACFCTFRHYGGHESIWKASVWTVTVTDMALFYSYTHWPEACSARDISTQTQSGHCGFGPKRWTQSFLFSGMYWETGLSQGPHLSMVTHFCFMFQMLF